MIYIQSTTEGLPHHHEASCVMFGAIETKQPYTLISYEQLLTGDYDSFIKHHLFVGTVEFMKEVWKRGGVKPYIPNNPSRPSEEMTLYEAKLKVAANHSIFIKPKELKLFTGFVLDESHYKCLDNVPDNTIVLTYKPFKKAIVSEWRYYIKQDEIWDCKNYSGEFDMFPNAIEMEVLVEKYYTLYYKELWNKCYTMDIALFADDSIEVIELNDMWAIGNYGVPNDIYLDLLKTRYFEIIKSE